MVVPRLESVSGDGGRPRVSVVMPTYKRPHMIGDSLATVVAQTFSDMEILVKADGTSDETWKVIQDIGDPRVRFSQTPTRLGVPEILNSLIRETCGEFVLVLHDHDLYHPKMLAEMVDVLDSNPGALYVHTGLERIDERGVVLGRYLGDYKALTPGKEWLRYMLSRFDSPVCALAMVRRAAYERHGLYISKYGFIADVEMWMRLSCHGDVAYIPKVLIQSRVREASHEYRAPDWNIVDSIIRIHDLYRSEQEQGEGLVGRARIALRTECFRFVTFLASMKNTQFSRTARAEARQYLRSRGGVITSLLGRLIPS